MVLGLLHHRVHEVDAEDVDAYVAHRGGEKVRIIHVQLARKAGVGRARKG